MVEGVDKDLEHAGRSKGYVRHETRADMPWRWSRYLDDLCHGPVTLAVEVGLQGRGDDALEHLLAGTAQ